MNVGMAIAGRMMGRGAAPVLKAVAVTNFPSTTASPLSVNLPPGIQAGNTLVLLWYPVSHSGTALSGWTAITGLTGGDDALYWRTATGTEGSTVSLPLAGSSAGKAVVLLISGADKTTPIVANAWTQLVAGGSTTVAAPAVSTTVPNSLLVQFAAGTMGTTNGTTSANNGMASANNATLNFLTSQYMGNEVATKQLLKGAAAGTTTFTFSISSTYSFAASFIVQPPVV